MLQQATLPTALPLNAYCLDERGQAGVLHIANRTNSRSGCVRPLAREVNTRHIAVLSGIALLLF